MNYLMIVLQLLLIVSSIGYLFSVIKEKADLRNNKIHLNSKKISQKLIDETDYKIFKLGNTKLNIGDEIKVYLRNNKLVRGTLVGAKKKNNSLCLVTREDEVLELSIPAIKKLKITSKYGRIF